MDFYIPRQLKITTEEKIYSEEELFALHKPLIILAEAGAGKTTLLENFAKDIPIFDSNELSLDNIERNTEKNQKIIIDAFDEGTLKLATLLKTIKNKGYIDFILTCRIVEWENAFNNKILNSFQEKPIIAHLLPFNEQNIIDFIQHYDESYNGNDIIAQAKQHHASEFLHNPQTLKMVLDVVKKEGWFDSKKQLYKKTCDILAKEHNDIHMSKLTHSTNSYSPEDILECAGFICSQLLFAYKNGINIEGKIDDESFSTYDELYAPNKFPKDCIRFVCSTKIFQAVGADKVMPCHRTIAEYLSARWLSKQFNKTLLLGRLEGLLYADEKIVFPALRGLHAWLAVLDTDNTRIKNYITQDAFGVFCYGDVTSLSLEHTKYLLKSLEDYAQRNPYLGSEDWGLDFTGRLKKLDLKEDIIRIISETEKPQLAFILIQSVAGTELAENLLDDLKAIMLNPEKTFSERRVIADVLLHSKQSLPWDGIIQSLQDDNDFESLRLALDIVGLKTQIFTGKQIADILIGLEKITKKNNLIGVGWDLENKMSCEQLEEALEILSAYLPKREKKDNFDTINTQEWSRKFIKVYLEKFDKDLTIEKIGSWIKNLKSQYDYHDREWNKFTQDYFSVRPELRRGLQRYSLGLIQEIDSWWSLAGFKIIRINNLHFTEEDALFHFKNALLDNNDILWKVLLDLAKSYKFNRLIEYATEQAKDHPELQEYVTQYLENMEQSVCQMDIYEKEDAEIQQKHEQEKEQAKQARHKHFKDIQDNIKNGTDLYALSLIAQAYLGYPLEIDNTLPALERVVEWSGKDMASHALEGIRVCIEHKKHDIPSARDIILLKMKGEEYLIQPIIIVYCHLYMQEHGSLQGLDLEFLKSTLVACHWGVDLLIGIGEIPLHLKTKLENIIFANKEYKEDFIRDVIEPSLEHKKNDIPALDNLLRDKRFSDIASDLAFEWLGKYELSDISLDYILSILICDKPDDLISLIRQNITHIRQNITHKDDDAERYGMWMGAAFLLAFEEHFVVLTQYAKENKDFLWRIKNLAFPDRYGDEVLRDSLPILTARQNAFIIENFGNQWSLEGLPDVTTLGIREVKEDDPYEMERFIRGRIRDLSQDISPEAIEFLRKLSENPECFSYHDTLKHARHEQQQKQADEKVKAQKYLLWMSGIFFYTVNPSIIKIFKKFL